MQSDSLWRAHSKQDAIRRAVNQWGPLGYVGPVVCVWASGPYGGLCMVCVGASAPYGGLCMVCVGAAGLCEGLWAVHTGL